MFVNKLILLLFLISLERTADGTVSLAKDYDVQEQLQDLVNEIEDLKNQQKESTAMNQAMVYKIEDLKKESTVMNQDLVDEIEDPKNQQKDSTAMNQDLEIQIEDLKNQQKESTIMNQDLVEEIIDLKQQLKQSVADLKDENVLLKTDMTLHELGLEGVKEEVKRLDGLVLEIKNLDPVVAFTAAATSHQEVEQGERYVFDDVMTNVGGWYNSEFSEFTCPLDGYYMFSVSLMNQLGFRAYGSISVEGKLGPYVVADSRQSGDYGHATSVYFAHCKQAERVWVQQTASMTGHLFGSNYSSFSGMLVKAAPESGAAP